MAGLLFADRPWRQTQYQVDPHAMITAAEAKLLNWLGKSNYSGIGEIVELGSFMGGSTNALASGLAENARVAYPDKRLHCFDLFQHFEGGPPGLQELFRQEDVGEGESFVNSFLQRTWQHQRFIELHCGSIFDQKWSGRPIEILFVDAAKTWPLNDAILRLFYGALIPEHSLVVHQDFLFSGCPWVAILMAYAEDYFELVGEECPTLLFRCTRPLPTDLLLNGITRLSERRKFELFDRWRDIFEANGLAVDHDFAKVIMLVSFRRYDEARNIATDLWRAHPHLFHEDGWYRTVLRLWRFDLPNPLV